MLNHWHAVYAEIYGGVSAVGGREWRNGECMGAKGAAGFPAAPWGEFLFYAAMSAYSKNMWPMALQTTPVMPGLTR